MGSGRMGRAFKLWPPAICLSYWAPRSHLLSGDSGTWDCWPSPLKLLWVGREHRVLLLVFWTGEALGYKLGELVSRMAQEGASEVTSLFPSRLLWLD